MSNTTKIQTHAGVFHADEVLACSIIALFTLGERYSIGYADKNLVQVQGDGKDILILRSHDLSKSGDQELVIDIGGQLDLNKGLLDHHQYSGGKAACELALDWLLHKKLISDGMGEHIRPFLASVSRWDTGAARQEQEAVLHFTGMENIPSLISRYNRVGATHDGQTSAFIRALNFGMEWLSNLKHSAELNAKSLTILANGKWLRSAGALVCDEHPTQWKEQVDDSVQYLVSPSAYKEGQWQVLSRDAAQNPLPDNGARGLVFVHNAKFIAAFDSKEHAVEYARAL